MNCRPRSPRCAGSWLPISQRHGRGRAARRVGADAGDAKATSPLADYKPFPALQKVRSRETLSRSPQPVLRPPGQRRDRVFGPVTDPQLDPTIRGAGVCLSSLSPGLRTAPVFLVPCAECCSEAGRDKRRNLRPARDNCVEERRKQQQRLSPDSPTGGLSSMKSRSKRRTLCTGGSSAGNRNRDRRRQPFQNSPFEYKQSLRRCRGLP
jgi:hypothetical protein